MNIESISQKISQGITQHQAGNLETAKICYEEILSAQPDHHDALHLLGMIKQQTGEPKAALQLFEHALMINNQNPVLQNNVGNILRALGRFEESSISYQNATMLSPDYAEAHHHLSQTLYALNKMDEARAACEKALYIQGNFPEAYISLGNIYFAQNNLPAALSSYKKAIEQNPQIAEGYHNIGVILSKHGNANEALTFLNNAIELKPQYCEAILCRGILHFDFKEYDLALSNFEQAIAINPRYAEAHSNRSTTLRKLGRFDEGLESAEKAISIAPNFSQAHLNHGLNLYEQRSVFKALQSYEKAIELDPYNVEAYTNKAIALLLLEKFDDGWKHYEWRLKTNASFQNGVYYGKPQWLGESLKGKTILLASEQGLGDALQFCRYAKLVRNLGAKVLLEVAAPLFDLLHKLDGVDQVITKGDKPPDFDYYIPLQSLPLRLNTRFENIPKDIAYIDSNKQKVAAWNRRLGKKHLPRVGLVWSSNSHAGDRDKKSISVEQFMGGLPAERFDYFCLQKEYSEQDKISLQKLKVQFFGGDLHNLSDTAALIECMDLVISIDTSVAHLSAALGKPTWILLANVPDWRWHLNKSGSPWYPTATLFRQGRNRDWSGVMTSMRSNLLTQFKNQWLVKISKLLNTARKSFNT
jgi:tetratricopeptide (TPR) repeat protein